MVVEPLCTVEVSGEHHETISYVVTPLRPMFIYTRPLNGAGATLNPSRPRAKHLGDVSQDVPTEGALVWRPGATLELGSDLLK